MPVPKLIISAGLMAANLALNMTRKIEGPRLDSLKFTGGDYNSPLPMLWGMNRVPGSIFWAEEFKEIKRRRKTKGGKFNEYTYYGTFAFAVAGHEVQAIRRLWFDKHLVLDFSGAGPVSPFDFGTGVGSGEGIKKFARNAVNTLTSGSKFDTPLGSFYSGTETQEPDPRMQATIEAEFGEGSCPAYRGVAYFVVKDLPLEKFGNRIPQIDCEVIGAVSGVFPTETITLPYQNANLVMLNDFSLIMANSTSGFSLIDTAARAVALTNSFTPALAYNPAALTTGGTIFGLSDSLGNNLYTYSLSGIGVLTEDINSSTAVRVVTDLNGGESWFSFPLYAGTDFYLNGAAYDLDALTGNSWTAKFAFVDADNALWVCGGDVGQTTAHFYRVSGTGDGPGYVTVTGLPTYGSAFGAFHYRDDTADQFVFEWDGDLYAVSKSDGTVLYSRTDLSTMPGTGGFQVLRQGRTSVWCGLHEVSLADLTTLRSFSAGAWGLPSVGQTIYDPINHALLTRPTGFTLRWLYLDRVGSNGVALSTIADDLAGWVDVQDRDFSDLDQTIEGFRATQGPAQSILDPLLDAYDSDIRPHDFSIQGVKRTGAAVSTTLSTAWMAEDTPRYVAKVTEGAELPLAVTIQFADLNADHQPNNVRASRPLDATGARGELNIDLSTLVLGADEAGQLARRYFRRRWNERREFQFGITPKELALEPGDVRNIELDGETYSARCVQTTIRTDRIETQWRYDNSSLAQLDAYAGAAMDGRDESAILIPLLSKGFVLDIPYLTDSDAQTAPIIYFGAAPLAAGGWTGASIFQSVDGEYSDEVTAIPSSAAATWGYANDALPDCNPNLWDRTSSINVTIQTGNLTGVTEAAIDANPSLNLAMFGSEIVNFTTATLEMDGSYTLSGFKRGRRGTEWACADHAVGEVFVSLANVQDEAMGLSEVNTNLSFKALTNGRTSAFPIDLTPYTGASLKPYAPCALGGVLDSGTGDWALEWVRRTRVGGAWTGGAPIPLSEASEEYEVEIMNGGTVVRTITALTSPSVTYTAAQQATDFGSGQTSITFRVYQVSDAVGRGFAATATI